MSTAALASARRRRTTNEMPSPSQSVSNKVQQETKQYIEKVTFQNWVGGIKGAGVAAATATPAMLGLLGVLLRLAAIGAIAIVINVAVTGMAAVYQAQAEISKLRGERAGGGAKSFGGSATAEQKKVQQQ